jgi:glucose-6-phosphate 1-dehydrogenase
VSRSPLRDLWRLSLEFLMDQSRQPAAVLAVDTWRWRGVPFRLRAGKALTNPRQEVVITFKKPPPIPAGFTGGEQPDRLHIGIALEAGRLSIDLNVNGPGDPREIDPVTL